MTTLRERAEALILELRRGDYMVARPALFSAVAKGDLSGVPVVSSWVLAIEAAITEACAERDAIEEASETPISPEALERARKLCESMGLHVDEVSRLGRNLSCPDCPLIAAELQAYADEVRAGSVLVPANALADLKAKLAQAEERADAAVNADLVAALEAVVQFAYVDMRLNGWQNSIDMAETALAKAKRTR